MKRSRKQTIGGKITLQAPSTLNKTVTHFLFSKICSCGSPWKVLQMRVHTRPGRAGILGASHWHLEPSPQKLFWPQKKCLRSLPSQGPTSAHPLAPPPPSCSGSNRVGLPNPSQWNSQIASLIIFKGSFWAGALTFISPPTLLPFFVGSPHSFSLPPHPLPLIWRSLTR